AADREADEPLDGGGRLQPLVDLVVVGAAAEDDAHDALAPALARLPAEHLAIRALVDALDLPDVDLDPGVLDLGDRATHQLRTQLGVVAVAVAVDRLQLRLLARHEQLEQELAVVLLEPVAQALELAELRGVFALVA